MTKVETLTKNNFHEALKDNALVLVDFWAAWCGPCRMTGPIIDQLAEQYTGKVLVGKVNIDEEIELASQYQVMSIPTVLIFKQGKEIDRQIGVMPGSAYMKVLDANI